MTALMLAVALMLGGVAGAQSEPGSLEMLRAIAEREPCWHEIEATLMISGVLQPRPKTLDGLRTLNRDSDPATGQLVTPVKQYVLTSDNNTTVRARTRAWHSGGTAEERTKTEVWSDVGRIEVFGAEQSVPQRTLHSDQITTPARQRQYFADGIAPWDYMRASNSGHPGVRAHYAARMLLDDPDTERFTPTGSLMDSETLVGFRSMTTGIAIILDGAVPGRVVAVGLGMPGQPDRQGRTYFGDFGAGDGPCDVPRTIRKWAGIAGDPWNEDEAFVAQGFLRVDRVREAEPIPEAELHWSAYGFRRHDTRESAGQMAAGGQAVIVPPAPVAPVGPTPVGAPALLVMGVVGALVLSVVAWLITGVGRR